MKQDRFVMATLLLAAESRYLDPSRLSDAEKRHGLGQLDRFAKGVINGKVARDALDQAVTLISEPAGPTQPKGKLTLRLTNTETGRDYGLIKESLSDAELRSFLAKITEVSDAAGLPEGAERLDAAAEFGKLVDALLAQQSAPKNARAQ